MIYSLILIILILCMLAVVCISVHFYKTNHIHASLGLDLSGYFKGFNATDYKVRGCKSFEACTSLYKNNIRPLTKDELRIIEGSCIAVDSHLIDFKLLANLPWKLATFDTKEIENGYPHTHGDTIIIPSDMINNPHVTISTLLHEKVHLFQRQYPLETNILIINFLGFQLDSMRYQHQNIRRNPDLNEIVYKDANGKVVLPTYLLEAKTLTDIEDHLDHPFEIMAYTIQNMYFPISKTIYNKYSIYMTKTRQWIQSLKHRS